MKRTIFARPWSSAALFMTFAVAACHSGGDMMPGDANDHRPWSGIATEDTIHLIGTEPFWGGEVGPKGLTYTTPEVPKAEPVPMDRFAGRGGVSFNGTLPGGATTLAITPQVCSDGMSDTTYPFAATLQIGEQTRTGCAWTDKQPRQPMP